MKARKGVYDVTRDLLVGSKHLERGGKPAARLPVGDRITFISEATSEHDLRPLSAQCPQQLSSHPLHASEYQLSALPGSPADPFFEADLEPTVPGEDQTALRDRDGDGSSQAAIGDPINTWRPVSVASHVQYESASACSRGP